MKRSIVFLFFMLMAFGAVAQSISVKSFRALPMDMTASSLKGKRVDQNGQVAALIKIVTSETGFTFEGGTLGIVDSKQENGEVWVWVPRASRKITIKHQQLGVLRDYRYPIEIEAERTYEMVLTTAEIETIIKEKITQQYLIFELEPKNAILEVNEQLWNVDADGTAMQYVDFGTYTYRVRAANYSIEAGVVTVEDPDNPVTVNVTLRPNLAQVTLTVDADAEIWVNNEKKGVRTWTGPLGDGTYKMECKQEGHETMIVSQKITAEMNGQTITLPAPKPIYGSLNVESNPNLATLYIDGKEIGKTPRPINEILVGQHELRLTQEGYKDHVETIVIAKGERKLVRATLDADGSVPVVEKPKKPSTLSGSSNVSGAYNGHDYVDLGLPSGTLWATCNVGAEKPEDYGDYYAWGETSTKTTYNWDTYQYCKKGDFKKLTKYCNDSEYGNRRFTDNLTVLQACDDAATANWGNGWCIPTKAQWEELKDNTTVIWTTQSGVSGRLFTASNGNSLFLPAAGRQWDSQLYNVGFYGGYWSRSLDTDGPNYAWYLYFYSGLYGIISDYRYGGFSVRPVREKYLTTKEITTAMNGQAITLPSPTPENNVFFIMANAAYSLAPQTSFGLTVGSLKRWGWYASVGTNFKYVSANYYCAADGTISSNTSNYYHYTKQETIRFSATAGAVARIYKPLYAYFGAGYGVRNLLWHFEGNVFSGIAKNTAYSHEGVALDAGMMFHLGHFSGSLGVQTVNFGYVEAKLGLGVNF